MLVQAQTLVAKMRASGDVDFENDWKIVTMLVGNNDVCSIACGIFEPGVQPGDPNLWIGKK